jgi:hypothetical protein
VSPLHFTGKKSFPFEQKIARYTESRDYCGFTFQLCSRFEMKNAENSGLDQI